MQDHPFAMIGSVRRHEVYRSLRERSRFATRCRSAQGRSVLPGSDWTEVGALQHASSACFALLPSDRTLDRITRSSPVNDDLVSASARPANFDPIKGSDTPAWGIT